MPSRDAGRGAGDGPVAIFTGGSMLVGSVGRTDLLGPEHARPYALDMHRSLHETLLRQPDEAGILPTHGAGSLCSRGIGRGLVEHDRRRARDRSAAGHRGP